MRTLALCALLTFAATSVVAVARADEPSKEGVQLYVQGRDFLSAGKPNEALPLLLRSLALLPSPNTELLIAHAHRDLGKKAQALEEYTRAEENARIEVGRGQSRYEETVVEARRARAELMLDVGTLAITAPRDARITVRRSVSDEVLLRGPGRVYVEPGVATVTLELGAVRAAKKVEVAAGATAEVVFEGEGAAAPAPEQGRGAGKPPSRFGALSIVGGVVSGLGAATFGLVAGFGVSAQSKYDDLEACETSCTLTSAEVEDLRSTGKRDELVTNVSIGVGSVLVAGGVLLVILDALDVEVSAETRRGRVRPVVDVGAQRGFVGVDVAF